MNDDPLSPEDLDRLARYMSGELAEAERAAFEAELLTRDDLAHAFYSELNLDELLREAAARRPALRPVTSTASERPSEPPTIERPTPVIASPRAAWWERLLGRRVRIPLAAGLAAVLALTLRRPSEPPVFRGGERSSRLLAPIGTLNSTPDRFVWTRYPGAARYRLTLQDASFTSVADTIVVDTTLAASAILPPSFTSGMWRITPIRGDGSLLDSSAPAQFHIER